MKENEREDSTFDPSQIVVEDLMVEDPKPHSIVRMKKNM